MLPILQVEQVTKTYLMGEVGGLGVPSTGRVVYRDRDLTDAQLADGRLVAGQRNAPRTSPEQVVW